MFIIANSELAVLYVCLGLFSILIIYYMYRIAHVKIRQWDLKINNNDRVVYQKYVRENWEEIQFEKIHYAPNFPRHVIYIEKDWNKYPQWVIENQKEIKLRLKKRFKHPEYTFVDKETNQAIDLDTWFSEDEDHSELLDR